MFLSDLTKETAEEIMANPPPEFNPESTTVVFLDQNKWGTLHNARHNPESPHQDSYETILSSANNGSATYPFSLPRQLETDEHSDLTFRRQLYELMLDLSHNICFKNFFLVTKAERIAYLKNCFPGHTEPGPINEVFDHGLIAPLGMPSFPGFSSKDNQKIRRFFRSERFARMLIQDDDYLAEAAEYQQQTDHIDLQKRENARQRSRELADTDEERWDILLARDLAQHLLPLLTQHAQGVNFNIQPHIHNDLQNHDFNIEEFLTQFPTYYCQIVLSHGRDFHWDRKIEANDLLDIMSLAVAIPYSDIVVTEQFFAGVAYKHDLHERFDTQILTGITDLSDRLPKQ
ncbi:hypothetical protein [Saliphagus infecundisoli]|uniref:Uncharacterized protein n=1 Tax=Saliphagus infecundisoli TaxID=1849069 RepID=A0ABD5QJT7_9EURY|nr:hypothetical protein [Saliphagus infecundisoli]